MSDELATLELGSDSCVSRVALIAEQDSKGKGHLVFHADCAKEALMVAETVMFGRERSSIVCSLSLLSLMAEATEAPSSFLYEQTYGIMPQGASLRRAAPKGGASDGSSDDSCALRDLLRGSRHDRHQPTPSLGARTVDDRGGDGERLISKERSRASHQR